MSKINSSTTAVVETGRGVQKNSVHSSILKKIIDAMSIGVFCNSRKYGGF